MKKICSLLIVCLTFMASLVAQPQKMTYQTVVRDANNELVVNQQVGVQITVIQDSMNGPMIYRETHTATTNGNALVTLAIGTGTHLYNNNLSDVKWGEHDHYLRVDIDPTGGINYTITGTQQLITVPYAFYAGAAKYVDTALYALNSNIIEKQVIIISNDTIYLKGDTNSFVKLPIAYVPDSISAFINDVGYLTSDSLPSNVSYFNNDAGYLTSDSLPANVSYFNNDAGYITSAAIPANVSYFNNDAGYITTFVDSQQISLSGDTLKLERGGSVLLAPSCCALVDSLNNVISVLQSIVCKPKVVTAVVTAISTDTAVCGGDATSPCGYAITEKGVCWNTTGFADMSDSHTSDGIGTGIFSSVLTGLSPNTTYYVRAYAICGNDTAYGEDVALLTLPSCTDFLDEQADIMTVCGGGGSYTWRGRTLTSSGVYYDSLKTSMGGCDSVYKLDLTFNVAPTYFYADAQTISVCGGGGSYTWRGRTLTSSGIYYDSLKTSMGGCDSVYKLDLTFNVAPTYFYADAQTISVCGGGGSYTWRGRTLTSSGVYYDSLTTVNTGCDSVYQLTLAFNVAQSYLFTDAQTVSASCGDAASYTWRGRTLTSSGVYYDSLTTVNTGCDSVYQLTLTINALTLTDYDNNVYNTVKIGSQCWMKENLKTRHYANGGTIIPLVNGTTSSTTSPYCYKPKDSDTTIARYGLLYNWKAVMGSSSSNNSNPSTVQGICPTGWHVPSEAEWIQLTDYLSSQSQYWCGANSTYIAKSLAAVIGWTADSGTCTPGNAQGNNNLTGFTAMAAGYYRTNWGMPDKFGYRGVYLSCTEKSSTQVHSRMVDNTKADISDWDAAKDFAYSVRCLKN